MMKSVRLLLLCSVAWAACSAPAFADAWGDGIEVVAEEELDTHRGGFDFAGITFNFGAIVTTSVNGTPALVTELTWSNTGAIVSQTVGNLGQSISTMSPDALAALGLDGMENADGVVIDDADGVTTLVHNVTEGALQNIIINNATGRDLSQQVDVTLELPGFEAMQQAIQTELFGFHLTDDMLGIAFYDPGG